MNLTRPDIVHATCYYARYQVRPTEKHLKEVKRIFRYLKNTINMGLWYPEDTGFELTAFSDSDHAGCLDTRKSTSSGIQFLGGDKIVSWSSKKKAIMDIVDANAQPFPSIRVSLKRDLSHLSRRYMRYLLTSNSDIVDIEKVAVSSSLRSLKLKYKLQCCSLVPAKSDSLPHAHAQAFKVKHSASRLLLLNKNVISRKAQVHVKFSNYDNYKIPHHQRYSTSNKEVFSRETVSLRSILWEIDRNDEEEEVTSFRDKYDHVGQKQKLIKKVKSR
ncbi:hypothetical protein Tco_0403641 [Tanacetum coccineum]